MSTWGSGNFDNDAARDHLFELMQGLADSIEDALNSATESALSKSSASQSGTEAIEHLDTVLPNIEIICLLHESLGGGFLPEPSVVADWRSRFEKLHADAEFTGESATAERRAVIAATFDRLQKLAEQCWDE